MYVSRIKEQVAAIDEERLSGSSKAGKWAREQSESRAALDEETRQDRRGNGDQDDKKERKNHSVKAPESARDSCERMRGGGGGGGGGIEQERKFEVQVSSFASVRSLSSRRGSWPLLAPSPLQFSRWTCNF